MSLLERVRACRYGAPFPLLPQELEAGEDVRKMVSWVTKFVRRPALLAIACLLAVCAALFAAPVGEGVVGLD